MYGIDKCTWIHGSRIQLKRHTNQLKNKHECLKVQTGWLQGVVYSVRTGMHTQQMIVNLANQEIS